MKELELPLSFSEEYPKDTRTTEIVCIFNVINLLNLRPCDLGAKAYS